MAYTKYTTEAFVITSRESGEADKIFKLYTRDFGMVFALAKGIRHLKSKLKGHVGSGGKIRISLIRGKDFWRLIEAEDPGAEKLKAASSRHFSRILGIVSRLIRGEEPNPEMFAILEEFQAALRTSDVPSGEGFELIASAKILKSLGYLSPEPLFAEASDAAFGETHAVDILSKKRALVPIINRVLAETHL